MHPTIFGQHETSLEGLGGVKDRNLGKEGIGVNWKRFGTVEIVIKRFQKKEKDIKMGVGQEDGWIWEEFVEMVNMIKLHCPKHSKN